MDGRCPQGYENQLRARLKDIAAQYEKKIKEMKALMGELTLQKIALEKYTANTPERQSEATTPQGKARGQNGMIGRFFRTIKEGCILHHNFTSLKEANETIGDWIRFYNEERRYLALKCKTSQEVFQLAS